MKLFNSKYLFFAISLIHFNYLFSQVVVNTGNYRNQFFVGAGYNDSFGSVNYGFNHTKYFKIIKKEITGILDFNLPLSPNFYTRFIFRKGFQFIFIERRIWKEFENRIKMFFAFIHK